MFFFKPSFKCRIIFLFVASIFLQFKSNTPRKYFAGQDQDILVDLEKLFPHDPKFMDDNLHFNPGGYDLVGEHIFNTLATHFKD